MAQPLPQFIFVKPEDGEASGDNYFLADVTTNNMVSIGEKVIVGEYQLVATYVIEGTIQKTKKG